MLRFKAAFRSEDARARTLAAGAAVLAFAPALAAHGWPRDDRALILENPLLRAGLSGAGALLGTGYWQAVMGAETPIHQWRPALSLSFLLQTAATGFAPLPLHAVNLALHALVAALLLECLRPRLGARAALAGALVFAVLPVHAESVAYLTSRSELLAAISVLGSWLLLGSPRRPAPGTLALGAGVYLLGALSKEHALLFPPFLALSDWCFERRRPWEPERRRVHLALAACAALVLLGRAAVLPALAHGGEPYFAGVAPLARVLTTSKFWVWHYARPLVLGAGLCADYARPLIPDSGERDPAAWAALAALLAAFAVSARAVLRGDARGFWLLGPCLFLAPTSHLFIDLDSIGAQRFLYLPSIGLAAAAGASFVRAEKRRPLAARAILAAAVLALGARAAVRAGDWRDDESYYRAAAACNPVSAKARSGLGTALLRSGRDGRPELEAAISLDPRLYDAAYNLARLEYGRGAFAASRSFLARARTLRPDAPDSLVLQALLDSAAGRHAESERALTRALEVLPGEPTALYNRALARARLGRADAAAAGLREFLRRAPGDPDAGAARTLLAALEVP